VNEAHQSALQSALQLEVRLSRSMTRTRTPLYCVSDRTVNRYPTIEARNKSPRHSIDHKVEKLDHIAFVKSGAKGKRKARDSDEEGDDEEGDEEGEMDTQRRPVSKRQRGQGQTRHPCKPPSHEVQHINAVTDADTCSGIDSDDPIDFL